MPLDEFIIAVFVWIDDRYPGELEPLAHPEAAD